MAGYVNYVGFETGDGAELYAGQFLGNGGGSIAVASQTHVHSGAWAARIKPATGQTPSFLVRGVGTNGKEADANITGTSYLSFYIYFATFNNNNYFCAINHLGVGGGGYRMRLFFTSTGLAASSAQLGAQAVSGAISGPGYTLLPGQWYRFDTSYNAATGAWAVYVNGQGTPALFGTSQIDTIDSITFGESSGGSGTSDYYIDDIFWRDDTFSSDDSIGLLVPAQDSATNVDFTANTGTKYNALGQVPSDGDTTRLDSIVANAAYSGKLLASSFLGPVIASVGGLKPVLQLKNTPGTTATAYVLVRSNATNSLNAVAPTVGASYATLCRVLSRDPTDGQLWSSTKLDLGVEIGVKMGAGFTGGDGMRVTSGWGMVAYRTTFTGTSSFVDMRMPQRICEEFQGGPTFATSLVRARSGYTVANVDRPDPVWVYEGSALLKDFNLRNQLMAFYLALKGMGQSFRFRDMLHYWTGCDVYGGIGDIAPLAPANITSVGTGDGTTKAFQLYVPYTFAGYTTLRKLTKPCKWGAGDTNGDNPGYLGPHFWVNDVAVTAGNWSLDAGTGIVTFATAPGAGQSVKHAGLFDVQVRWQDDQLVMALLGSPEAADMKLRIIEELT